VKKSAPGRGAGGPFRFHFLFRLLVERDLRERYAGSFMGLSWSLLQPLAMFLLYDLVFSVILKVKPDPLFGDVPFAIWLMAGLAPWLLLAEVLARSPMAVNDHSRMVTKNPFPNELLPTVTATSALVNHLSTLTLLVAYLSFKGLVSPSTILDLLPWLFLLAVQALGIAWIFSAVGVYFRDLSQLTGLLTMAWSFATPIFYPESAVPERIHGLLSLNPAFLIVRGYRMALLGRPDTDWRNFAMAGAWALAVAGVGFVTFRRLKRGFADYL
jgi:lipopolysaccharide transport system permease protein